MLSRTDREEPIRTRPQMEIAEPKRATLRNDIAEPRPV
jgi:hypothetical protein